MLSSTGPHHASTYVSRKALKYALKYGALSPAHVPLASAPVAATSHFVWSKGGYSSQSPRGTVLHLAPAPTYAPSQPQRIQACLPVHRTDTDLSHIALTICRACGPPALSPRSRMAPWTCPRCSGT